MNKDVIPVEANYFAISELMHGNSNHFIEKSVT